MPRRVSPLSTPLTRAWRSLAENAIAAKADAAHGERGRQIEQAAKRAQTTTILVRRAITTRMALMRLEARSIDVPETVFSLPIGAAEAVARWAGRDPQTAWRYAADYAQDRITFQALVDAEREARGGRTVPRRPRAGVEDPDAWRAKQVRRLAAINGRRVVPPAPDDLPVHGWLHGDGSVPTGVLVVGQQDDLWTHMAQRTASCVTAVGIARLVGHVVIIVPSDDVRAGFVAWLTERSVSPDEVRVVTVAPSGRLMRGKKASPDGAGQS